MPWQRFSLCTTTLQLVEVSPSLPATSQRLWKTGIVGLVFLVDSLALLLKKLEKDGVKVERTEDEPGNGGHFAWVRDGEGNLVELWEPKPGG